MKFERKRRDFQSTTAASDEKGKALYKPAGLKRTKRPLVARFSVCLHWRSYLRAHGLSHIKKNSGQQSLNRNITCMSQGRQDTVALASIASYWSYCNSVASLTWTPYAFPGFGSLADWSYLSPSASVTLWSNIRCHLLRFDINSGSRYVVPALTHSAS